MPSKKLSAFIAFWDKNLGAKLVDQYPKSTTIDLELVTTQIFLAFQTFYASEEELQRKIKRTIFKLPLKNFNLKASIFIDQFKDADNRDNNQPFILALLIPDYITDEDLNKFDKIISKYRNKPGAILSILKEIQERNKHKFLKKESTITLK